MIEGSIDELREHIKAISTITVCLAKELSNSDLGAPIARFKNKCPAQVDFDVFRNTLTFVPHGKETMPSYLTLVLKWLEAEGIPFTKFATTEPSLEEVFLAVQAGRANLDDEAD